MSGARKIVSRSWYATAGWSFVKKVSIETKPSASTLAADRGAVEPGSLPSTKSL